ncbi:dihydrofolate reductase family protein [Haladaptatus sp. DYF46]|uniref:dihydrofolate reductase family protein n=1 Tax=Haladaptatus sp. DYF46 TaxID=2886041 RepID=UPI001E531561|nr:dihydrofolate reductase family protein [Haladaptatus sp. DYF46]
MRKLVVDSKVTLDGVFDNQNEWQWQIWEDPDELVRYSKDHVTGFDALLLGRMGYQGLSSVWPSMTDDIGYANWINSIPKHVVSTTLDEDNLDWNAHLIAENVADEVAALKQQDGQDILMPGSADLMHTLMQHNLIDEYRIWVHPIIQGSGKQLFKEKNAPTGLDLVEMETTSSGVVILQYQPTVIEGEA